MDQCLRQATLMTQAHAMTVHVLTHRLRHHDACVLHGVALALGAGSLRGTAWIGMERHETARAQQEASRQQTGARHRRFLGPCGNTTAKTGNCGGNTKQVMIHCNDIYVHIRKCMPHSHRTRMRLA